jgi:hypothetical protein
VEHLLAHEHKETASFQLKLHLFCNDSFQIVNCLISADCKPTVLEGWQSRISKGFDDEGNRVSSIQREFTKFLLAFFLVKLDLEGYIFLH